MRLSALIPAFALCLTPFASAQSGDQDLREAIRKIVREEIQAALKDMHQPMVIQGHQIAVPGLPAGSFHVTTKAKPAKEGQEGSGMMTIQLGDGTEGEAHVLNLGGMKGMKVVEGHPIQLGLGKLLEGKLEGLTGNVQVKVVHDEDDDDDDDKGGEGEHEHEGKGHDAKKAMMLHAGPGTMVFQIEGNEGKDGQSPLMHLLKAHETTAAQAAKAAAECCEAAKEAESCCEVAKEVSKASTCCEGEKCEKCPECVIEVAPVAAKKAEKKAKKASKKGKKAKPVENEEFELKIG